MSISCAFEAVDERRPRHTNLVPKARTKKELAQRKADEEGLAEYRKEYQYIVGMNCWWPVHMLHMLQSGASMQKARARSDCCVTLVLSVE